MLYLLFILFAIIATANTEFSDLDNFLKSVEAAEEDLSWIRSQETYRRRNKRDTISQLLSSFNEPTDVEEYVAGDAWYNDFRAQECRNGNCPGKSVHTSKRCKNKKKKKKGRCKHRKKRPKVDAKIPKESPEYDYYNNVGLDETMGYEPKAFRDNNSPKMVVLSGKGQPQDQVEETRNDLSHEANYKLSKFEQEAAEHSPVSNSTWQTAPFGAPFVKDKPVRSRDHTQIGLNLGWNVAEDVKGQAKRSLSPLDEIKLRTSSRMMDKGLGASLPSDALETRRLISVQQILRDKKHDEMPDVYAEGGGDGGGDLRRFGRRLMFANEYRSPTHKEIEHAGMNIMGDDEFDNLRNSYHSKYGFEDTKFDNLEKSHIEKGGETQKDDGLTLTLSDELFKTPEFMRLESFLKGSKDVTGKSAKPAANKTKTTTAKPSSNSTVKAGKPAMATCSANSSTHVGSASGKNVNIKLQMSVNATVLSNDTDHIPNGFHKKSVITFPKIAGVVEETGLEDDEYYRDKRGIIFPALTSLIKRRTNKDVREKVMANSEQYPLDDLVSGKLPSQLVKTIYTLVKSNPDLKLIWPGLKKHKPADCKAMKNFEAIRTEDNESQIQKSEQMLRQVMDTINAIVEQQVRSRTCIPLRPDLQKFYDQILASHAENEKESSDGKSKRGKDMTKDLNFDDLDSESDSEDDVHAIFKRDTAAYADEPRIRQKYSVVKKLLREHDQLTPADQERAKSIKDSLQMDLVQLRKLKRQEERKKRQRRQVREERSIRISNPTVKDELSPEFLKLLRTGDLMRRNRLQSSIFDDNDVVFS